MRFDVSNTWEGKAVCVKTKLNSYYVIQYRENIYNQSFVVVYDADNRGVVSSFVPVQSYKYHGKAVDKFEEKIKELEYIPKKKKLTKKKSTKKTEIKEGKLKSNIKKKPTSKRPKAPTGQKVKSTKKKTKSSKKEVKKEKVKDGE